MRLKTQSIHCLFYVLTTFTGCDSQTTSPTGTNDGQPRISIPNPDRFIGVVPFGSNEIEFDIYNNGIAELRLIGLETSCSCTHVEVDDETIPPGSQTTLRVRITPKQPEQRSGRVIVYSNDPDCVRTEVHVSWQAVGHVIVEPRILDFGTLKARTLAKQHLKIMYELREDYTPYCNLTNLICRPNERLVGQKCGLNMLDGRLVETWEFELNYDSDSDVLASNGVVNLFFSNREPAITVPVVWQCQRAVEVSPPRLFLGSRQPGHLIEAKALLCYQEGTNLQIDDIKWRKGVLNLHVSPKPISESSIEILITGECPAKTGLLQDELIIHTSRPVESEHRIPVTAFVLAKNDETLR